MSRISFSRIINECKQTLQTLVFLLIHFRTEYINKGRPLSVHQHVCLFLFRPVIAKSFGRFKKQIGHIALTNLEKIVLKLFSKLY